MADKTYAETMGAAPFDWWKALDNPPDLEPAQHWVLMRRSADWVSCACGNQCAIIPRTNSPGMIGVPVDQELRQLGYDFHANICRGGWGSAKSILKEIEARSTILIQEELAKLNHGQNIR